MRKKLYLLMFVLSVMFYGCAGFVNDLKHFKSDIVGLNRHIVLYRLDGGIIKEWHTTAKIEDNGGTCYFIVNGKAITISGTFIIEEE